MEKTRVRLVEKVVILISDEEIKKTATKMEFFTFELTFTPIWFVTCEDMYEGVHFIAAHRSAGECSKSAGSCLSNTFLRTKKRNESNPQKKKKPI